MSNFNFLGADSDGDGGPPPAVWPPVLSLDDGVAGYEFMATTVVWLGSEEPPNDGGGVGNDLSPATGVAGVSAVLLIAAAGGAMVTTRGNLKCSH